MSHKLGCWLIVGYSSCHDSGQYMRKATKCQLHYSTLFRDNATWWRRMCWRWVDDGMATSKRPLMASWKMPAWSREHIIQFISIHQPFLVVMYQPVRHHCVPTTMPLYASPPLLIPKQSLASNTHPCQAPATHILMIHSRINVVHLLPTMMIDGSTLCKEIREKEGYLYCYTLNLFNSPRWFGV